MRSRWIFGRGWRGEEQPQTHAPACPKPPRSRSLLLFPEAYRKTGTSMHIHTMRPQAHATCPAKARPHTPSGVCFSVRVCGHLYVCACLPVCLFVCLRLRQFSMAMRQVPCLVAWALSRGGGLSAAARTAEFLEIRRTGAGSTGRDAATASLKLSWSSDSLCLPVFVCLRASVYICVCLCACLCLYVGARKKALLSASPSPHIMRPSEPVRHRGASFKGKKPRCTHKKRIRTPFGGRPLHGLCSEKRLARPGHPPRSNSSRYRST